jgi:hypothetical protein
MRHKKVSVDLSEGNFKTSGLPAHHGSQDLYFHVAPLCLYTDWNTVSNPCMNLFELVFCNFSSNSSFEFKSIDSSFFLMELLQVYNLLILTGALQCFTLPVMIDFFCLSSNVPIWFSIFHYYYYC